MERHEDRIDRASWLIGRGHVQPGDGADVLTCWSQQYGQEKIYTVTVFDCECYEGQNRKRILCKHRMACFAPQLVLMVLELREAATLEDLKRIGEEYREAMELLDPIFINKAREEYVKCRNELQEQVVA